MNRTTAYIAASLAIAAEAVFLYVWATDPRERSVVRVSVLFWPLFMFFLAEAMRMSGRPGARERMRREDLRLSMAFEQSETERQRIARELDRIDMSLAPVLLWVLPVGAIAFGVWLMRT
jgi:signal transduction histidine kinase